MTEDKIKPIDKVKKLTGGNFWNPSMGEVLVGNLVAIREGKYKHNIYDIQTDKGIVTVPASTVLESVINKDLIEKRLRIDFLGWMKAGSQEKFAEKQPGSYRNFDVFLIEE